MNENEAIEELKYDCEQLGKGIPCDTSCGVSMNEAYRIAIEALEEIQQYRSIGTPDECRAAVEKQIAKKPIHFHKKYGKHSWKRKENGEIDDFAWDVDYHNGVVCEICGEAICVHCEPDYEKLEDCEIEYWTCPVCEKRIWLEAKYCDCGQKLDWSKND